MEDDIFFSSSDQDEFVPQTLAVSFCFVGDAELFLDLIKSCLAVKYLRNF